MATASTLNDAVDSALESMSALDWQTALDRLLPVKLLLATRPDTLMGGGAGMRYNSDTIDSLVDQCQSRLARQGNAANAAAGNPFFVQIPIRYERG